MFQITTASREKVKLMVGLTGPSGSGKTYSALQMAYGITGDWRRVVVVDTENKSALYYSGERTGPWLHVNFPATTSNGYHPNNWIHLIDYVEKQEGVEVLILDSITHEWEGVGGCLELVDAVSGSKFSNGWKIVTPLHRGFIDKMRHSKLHIIATMRSKQDYIVETNSSGKATPKKVGTKSVQREGTDYEFGIIFDIEMTHYATASKDRTGVFMPKGTFKIDAETGKELIAWANTGTKSPEALRDEYSQALAPMIEATEAKEIYSAASLQKKRFAKACGARGITERELMSTLSEGFLGKPMKDMAIYIDSCLEEGTADATQ